MTKILDAFGNPIPPKTSTQTGVETETNTKTSVSNLDEDNLYIQTPIFILFAEFLGYTSYFISIAEKWCNPKEPMPSRPIQTLLERDARTIYDEMLDTYSEDEIHNLYINFYSCGLDDLEIDLYAKQQQHGEDLPF